MKYANFLLLLCFIFSIQLSGQSYKKQQDQILVVNILSNGIIGGIGGAIHKKENEKGIHSFIKNFGKGCIGGLTKYVAKTQTYYLRNEANVFLAPLNRAIFFVGHSVSLNASMNQKSLENIYFNFYGINFNYRPFEEKGNKFEAKLSTGTLSSLILFSAIGHKFDLYKTLEYGQFYFELNPSSNYKGSKLNGQAGYNSIAIRSFDNNRIAQEIVPHEIVHTYQAYDFFSFSSFYKNKLEKKLTNSQFYNSSSKYISFDYEPLFFYLLYKTQPEPRYFKNYFEYEAEHFGRRAYINR